MSKPKPPPNPFPTKHRIVLDWKAYFIEFCKRHGEPVEYKGRLLFRDGWGYSNSDYQGPEFHPPLNNDELDVLILNYWTIRQTGLKEKILKLLHEKKVISEAMNSHSMPLQCMVTKQNPDGSLRREYQPVVLKELETKIQWIEDDLIECNERFKEIQQYHSTKENA